MAKPASAELRPAPVQRPNAYGPEFTLIDDHCEVPAEMRAPGNKIGPLNLHDYADKRNWPLSRGQAKKLRDREPLVYGQYRLWLDNEYRNQLQREQNERAERFRKSPEGLHERIEDLEEANMQLRLRVEALEAARPKGRLRS